MVRIDQADLVYRTEEAKYDAVVEDIAERHAQGPAGPGRHRLGREVRAPLRRCSRSAASRTRSSTPSSTPTRPRSSRWPATRARSRSPPTWPVEAPTSCSAARSSSSPTRSCASRASTRSRTPRSTRPPGPAMVERIKAQVAAEHDEVSELGGLYVVGTERHESRRIDNQLRGRSGRQGDPGESRFYLSLQDELMRLFKSDWVDRVLTGAQGPRRRPDREQAGHQRDRQRPGPGRVAELRVPQERPQVRRRDETASARSSTASAARCSRAPTWRSRSATFIDDVVDGYVTGATDGVPRGVGPRGAVDRAQAALPGLARPRDARGGGRRPRRPRPRRADRDAQGRRPGGVRPPRGGGRRGGHARARAAGAALGARPQVARAPLRDGLPARGHLPARLLPARPAGGVPARGLRHVRRDDGRHQGGVGRLPVQPRGRRSSDEEDDEVECSRTEVDAEPMRQEVPPRSALGRRGRRRRRTIRAKGLERPEQPQNLSYSAPERGRRGRGHAAAPVTNADDRSPGSAATRCAPAARARSTSSATARRAGRPA